MKLLCALLSASIVVTGSPALAAGEWTRTAFADPTDGAGRVVPPASPEPPKDPASARLDAQIAALMQKRRQTSLGGPIVVTSVGGGMVVGGGTIAVAAALACEDAQNDPDKRCRHDRADALIIAGSALAGVGLAMVITGASYIVKRRNERRVLGREILDLQRKKQRLQIEQHPPGQPEQPDQPGQHERHEQREKESLLDSIDYGIDLTGGRRVLAVRVAF